MARTFDVCVFLSIVAVIAGLELKQVLILSRHNIRTPLTADLADFSPNPWPIWKDEAGYLTQKGAKLEEGMGKYISAWLTNQNLLPEGCPNEKSVFVYSNTKQRTRESAKAFVRGAFKNCNISVYSIDSNDMDPVFNPVVRDVSENLKAVIVTEMQQKLNAIDLREAYSQLDEIVEIKNSNMCQTTKLCSLVNGSDEIIYEINKEPDINGPLAYGNSIVDSLLMSYYEGMPIEDIAWGKIKNNEQWKELTKITKENQNVRFNNTKLAKDIAKPLLTYIFNILKDKKSLKFILLHGHDSNLNSVMAAVGFKPYVLPNQNENTPLGGKIVIQKWRDGNRDLLKVDFFYLTIEQLREGSKISSDNPPGWVNLEIKECPHDENGVCAWDKFIQHLETVL